MSKEQPRQISFQEYIGGSRNQIVLAYDGAKEIALKNFDDLTTKFIEQIQLVESLKAQAESKIPVETIVDVDKSRNKKKKKK